MSLQNYRLLSHLRTLLIALFLVVTTYLPTLAQACPYTAPGSTVNTWDWRIPRYTLHIDPPNQPNRTETVDSPFHASNYSLPHNTGHLAWATGADYQPADGWELLYEALGRPGEPVSVPAFALYNRLSGLTRLFFYLYSVSNNSPRQVVLTAEHSQLVSGENLTGLFESMQIPANALQNFTLGGAVGQLNQLVNRGGWTMLEFVPSFDPCVCTYVSSLLFKTKQAEVTDLGFALAGDLQTRLPLFGPGASLGANNGTALNYVYAGPVRSMQAGYRTFYSLNELRDLATDEAAQLLPAPRSALPAWWPATNGAEAGLLGFTVAQRRTSRLTTYLTGFNPNFVFNSNQGNILLSSYTWHAIRVPGSKPDTNYPVFRPVYDNPLGVLTVLEPPTVLKTVDARHYLDQTGEYEDFREETYRFGGNLRYAINTAAGLANQPVRLMGALVWNTCDWEDGQNETFYSTPLIDLGCLEDYSVTFRFDRSGRLVTRDGDLVETILNNGCYGAPALQIMAVLTDQNGLNEVVYSQRYRMQVEEVEASVQPNNPWEGLSAEEIAAACQQPAPAPVSSGELKQFCQTSYNPRRAELVDEEPKQENPSHTPASLARVAPNPIHQVLGVQLPSQWAGQQLALTLFNALGQPVWEYATAEVIPGEYSWQQGISNLAAGQYYLRIQGEDFVETHGVVKQ